MTPYELWESCLPLVEHLVGKQARADLREDMRQEACLQLWIAAQSFHEEYGVKFSTYAYNTISFAILLEKNKSSVFGVKASKHSMKLPPVRSMFTKEGAIDICDDRYMHPGKALEDRELFEYLVGKVEPKRTRDAAIKVMLEKIPIPIVSKQMGTTSKYVWKMVTTACEQMKESYLENYS